jgi:hypothetical protein
MGTIRILRGLEARPSGCSSMNYWCQLEWCWLGWRRHSYQCGNYFWNRAGPLSYRIARNLGRTGGSRMHRKRGADRKLSRIRHKLRPRARAGCSAGERCRGFAGRALIQGVRFWGSRCAKGCSDIDAGASGHGVGTTRGCGGFSGHGFCHAKTVGELRLKLNPEVIVAMLVRCTAAKFVAL